MRKAVLLAGALVAVAGCATVSQMAATGGSRADGIVKLSFEYGMFDKVQLDMATAQKTAEQRCATWGYSGAEPFGGITRQCQMAGTYGCTQWFATVEYQCLSTSGSQPLSSVTAIQAVQAGSPIQAEAGPRKVRAKTASGYCLDVPADYVGTGSTNKPAISSAMPRCSSLSAN